MMVGDFVHIGPTGVIVWRIIRVWSFEGHALVTMQHTSKPEMTTTRRVEEVSPALFSGEWKMGDFVSAEDTEDLWQIVAFFPASSGTTFAVLERSDGAEIHLTKPVDQLRYEFAR